MPKVSRWLQQINTAVKDRIITSNPSTYFMGLYNAATPFVYAYTWADLVALECSFKGYARVNVTTASYPAQTEPTAGKWQWRSSPLYFAYNSAAGGLASETAYGWFLIEMSGGVENLLEFEDLLTPKLFNADGVDETIAHKVIDLNCAE